MNEILGDTIDYETDTLFETDPLEHEDTAAVATARALDDGEAPEDAEPEPLPPASPYASACPVIPPLVVDGAGPPSELDQELLFRQLVAQHQRRLYRFVIKYIDHPDDAADITQQAFVEAARTIASFRGDSKLSTWLFGIAMNMVRNYLSRAPHRVHRFETDESLIGVPSSEPDPSDSLVQKELLIMAERAFCDLPVEMSEVLGLVAIDEISYQDAADILSIPLGTVRSRVSRARAVMRAQFEQAGVKLQF